MNVVAGRFQYTFFFICRASPQLADSLTISDFVWTDIVQWNINNKNKDQESSLNIFCRSLLERERRLGARVQQAGEAAQGLQGIRVML